MKISKSNSIGLIISSILTAITGGAILGYLLQKDKSEILKNKAGKAARKLEKKGKTFKNKAKRNLESVKPNLQDLSN
jgi:hypothetical protein